MKKISMEVPEALDRQIRILAAQLDMNRSEFARLALREKVERLSAEGPDAGTQSAPAQVGEDALDQDAPQHEARI
jgi:hypothetical protein